MVYVNGQHKLISGEQHQKHFKKPNHKNNKYSTPYLISNFQSKKRVRENLIRLKKNQQKER